jgi:hypothetical protein
MLNHDAQIQPKISGKVKIVFSIIAIFSIICVFTVWYKTTAVIKSARDYQPLAVAAMQKECALRCAQYGLTQKDFMGPKLEHAAIDKSGSNYLFSWNASSKNMQLAVLLTSTGSVANAKIKTQWVSLGTQ